MKELSVRIQVQPVKSMRKESYNFMTSDYFTFLPSLTTSSAGTVYVCDLEVNIDKPDTDDLIDFSMLRSCIVNFTDSAGNLIKIGTDDIPAKVIISPNLNTAVLKIQCSMLTSPLIYSFLYAFPVYIFAEKIRHE
ncbi:hypothetical protein H6A66_11905 [Bacteroides caecigallinarum]|uniref:hypothetical protein n=2 Tax=Bacteroides TaxID=816 RepID=UPI00195BA489|nr:hypothetical protein [Bacteroides caecigallinarum]MBM6865869.1 hypothetical protein [Bacteroides caecigallinarum]